MIELIVSANDSGQRLDKYLKKYLKEAPGSFIYKMLRKKNIVLNDKKCDGASIICESDKVKLYFSDETLEKMTGSLKTSSNPLWKLAPKDIIFEDDNLLLVNKPAGILSQKAHRDDYSINEAAVDYLISSGHVTKDALMTFTPSICNRLDRNTSGLIVIGKNYGAARAFSKAFHDRSLGKYYQCIVYGQISEKKDVKAYLIKDIQSNKVSVSNDNTEGSSYIETAYVPLKYNIVKNLTLLEVHLITGKTHQIRAHLQYMGHPVLGDRKYGTAESIKASNNIYHLKYQLLHATRLEMAGFTGAYAHYNGQVFKAAVPNIFKEIC